MSGEKTEKPTAKRHKEARKEGQVARTAELGAWISLLLFTSALPALAHKQADAAQQLMTTNLYALGDASPELAEQLLGQAVTGAFLLLVGLGSAVLVVSSAATLAQGGFYLATKAVKPSFGKLNPIKGIKRMLGPQAWWELTKMVIKTSLVGLLVWRAVHALMPLMGGTIMPIQAVVAIGTGEAMSLLRLVALAGVFMAAMDYLVARRRTGKQTRMTKEEVKQEHKNQEGDPLLKSAIRARQIAASRNRMIADVVDADVVLVNPTHVAVALRYRPERGAPYVVARGAGAIAARIREVASQAGVPLVQDVPLARALYRSTEVGMEIPAELFAAVAHVLAFVISRRGRGAYGGTHRSPRSESDLPDVPSAGRRRRRAPTDKPLALPSGAGSGDR